VIAPGQPSGLHRILIIDDNPAIHEDFRKILGDRPEDSGFSQAKSGLFGGPAPGRPRNRFDLDSAFQGAEGIEMARAAVEAGKPYNVAFVDVRMPPGLDGVETIAMLWRLDPDLQVVLCTAHSDYSWDEILDRLGRAESLVILKKPFDNIEVEQLALAMSEKWRLGLCNQQRMEELDQAVRQRTAALIATNAELRREIVDRIAAEQRMLESQSLHRQLLETLPAGVMVVDPVTRIIESANEQVSEMFGAPLEHIVGQRCTAFQCPDGGPSCPVCAPGRTVDSAAQELVRADGSRLPVMKWMKRIQIQGQEKLLECFIDESARKQAQYELLASEAQNRALIRAIPDMIFSNHRDGEFLTWHAADAGAMFLAPEHFLFRRPHEVLPAALADQFVGAIQRALGSGVVQEFNYTLPIGDEERCYEARVAPCTEDSALTIVRDITERTRAEERHRHLQNQLTQSQKMESLGLLAGGVAHDMNNVLGAILLAASANVEAQPAESRTRRAFETIAKAAVRGADMVKRLLSLARQHPAEDRELDLNALLLEEIHLLEHTTLARIDLEVDLAPDLQPLRGDANALAHTFMNLFVNALDAIPERGRIAIRTRNAADGWVEALVEDTGTGMPAEVLARATEPFYTTKGSGKGTGLGLSMAYSTVKAHGGRFEIASEPGRGTQVRLHFPANRPGVPGPEPAAETGVSGPAGVLTLLLVDDDEMVLESMEEALAARGHFVVLAATGEAALAKLERGLQPDVVILDMNMPGLGGAETLARIHALNPALPILLTTGRPDQGVLDLVQGYPQVTLLAKPFHLDFLKQKLQSLSPRRDVPSLSL